MGQDGNTIEIEIDAAATVAAAKTAGEANAKLVKFDQALGLFRDNVGLVSKTTEDVASVMGDFNTILGKFADNLVTNLADMQTSVVQKIEPHLERELENMVNRVLNKVEAKTGTSGESRSRSEAKQGAAAPTVTNTTAANVATAKQDSEFKRPDAIIKQMSSQIGSTVQDAITGAFTDTKTSRMRTEVTRTKLRQYSDVETGEQLEERTVTTDISNAISKAVVKSSDAFGKAIPLTGENKKMADLFNFLQNPVSARPSKVASGGLQSISDALDQSLGKGFADPLQQYGKGMNAAAEQNIWRPYEKALNDNEKAAKSATVAEKDRGIAIRREITGALIGLHVMKVVSQYSAVANAGFMMVFAALGHLLNNILLPMMPAFIIFAQVLHTVANVIQMLPMPIRQLIGALLIWKATSMLVASMPLKDIKDGFTGIKQVMDGSATGLQKFTNLVRAFIDFMNSGQGKGAVSWIGSGLGKVGGAIGGGVKKLLGKRAGGGPVLGHGAYIVGEKGPEIFVPKTSGSIIPNHKIGRAEGGDVEGGTTLPFGGDLLGSLGAGVGLGGLAYLLTGSPMLAGGAGLAGFLGPEGVANLVSSAVSSELGQNFIASMNVLTGMISAILAPLAPIMGVIGAVLGFVTGSKGAMGGDGGRTADAVVRVGNEQLKATGKMNYGVQNAVGMGNRGVNKLLSMILTRLSACLLVTPCVPGIFGAEIVAAITALGAGLALLPQAITVAIGDIAAKIKYTIETIGEKPVVTDIDATIRYTTEIVGEQPIVEDIVRTITYDVVTRGTEIVTVDKTATVTYDIVTRGTEPVVTDRAGVIEYVETIRPITEAEITSRVTEINRIVESTAVEIKTKLVDVSQTEISRVIDVANVATSAVGNEVSITSIVKSPTMQDIISRVGETNRILTENPAEMVVTAREFAMAEWNAIIEAKSVAEPAKITVTLLADGAAMPTIDVIPNLDVTALSGARVEFIGFVEKPISVPETSVALVPYIKPGTALTLPAGTEVKVPASTGLLTFNPGNNWEKVGENTYRYKGTTSANVEFKGGSFDPGAGWEKVGENLWRRRTPMEAPVEPKVVEGFNWGSIFSRPGIESAGRTAGGWGMAAVLLGMASYNASPNTFSLGQFLTEFVVGGIAVIGVTQIATAFAGAIGGPVVATAVATAIGSVFTLALTLIAVPLAIAFVADWVQALSTAMSTGDWSKLDFKTPFLAAAQEAGVAVGEYFRTLGERVGNYLAGHGMRSNEEIQNLLKANQSIATIDANPDLKLSDLGIELDASGNFVRNLDKFNADFKQTIAGGIPVDVKIDVDSVTSVVQQIGEASNLGGYTGPVVSDPGVGGGQPPINDPVQIGGNDPMGPYAPPVEPPVAYDPNNPEGLPTWVDPNPPPQCPEGQYFDSSLGTCVGGYYAAGGNVAPRIPVMVGEKGPELFIPDSSPTSIGGGGGGGSVTNHFTFNVTTNNPRELTDTVMKELKMELARVKM